MRRFVITLLATLLIVLLRMADAAEIPRLLEQNKNYAKHDHVAPPGLREASGRPNFLNFLIVSCVDSRVDPEKFLELRWAEAFVLKTVAGHPQQCLQDITILDTLSSLKNLIILHHTDCGASYVTNEGIRGKLSGRFPDHKDQIQNMNFGAISNSEDAVKNDVAWVRSHPLISKELKDNTVGMLYDLQTGQVKVIEPVVEHQSSKSEL